MKMENKRSVMILGSTGSVGLQAIDVARTQNYRVSAVCANTNAAAVEAQVREFGAVAAAMSDERTAAELKTRLADTNTRVYSGIDGICAMISEVEADTAVNSILGMPGLMPTLATLDSGKNLALANKESLVIAGKIVMKRAAERGLTISPVDSEHCAIAQCLRSGSKNEIKRLILTASGGPFFGKKRDELAAITVEQALAHPTWKMGAKITIDSATLMNKGFELIEAAHLFDVPAEKIDVIVHRESVIHSMVEYCDNSVIAQLSVPDMRLCVQYGVEAPARREAVIPRLDLTKLGGLTFAAPDEDTFVPLKLAKSAFAAGGAAPAVLHAANDVAVDRFIKGKLSFLGIFDTLSRVCNDMEYARECTSFDDIMECDSEARRRAVAFIDAK
jgi:1-deoxy-D-xylulose-5-phosphate reductoisomerase